MCGITGIFHPDRPGRPVDPAVLTAMTRSLAHRGPDGEAIWTAPGIGLGHRRLAILDPSPAGDQPMRDADRDCALTYNGEIYNFRELRRELEGRGHRFRSTGDTEVLLAGYAEWGREIVCRISGIFAFALWDGRRRELFLARDPLGVKPLFYAEGSQGFRFGSEIKAILTDPAVDRSFDLEALDAFLTFSYTPAPLTGFAVVRQLPPGHTAVVSDRGVEIRRYWDNPYSTTARPIDFATALAEFDERFSRAVASQMVSDVGIGALLSGGIDSAAVVRAMGRADTAPVHAFSVGFDWQGFDELPRARQTAARLGIELTEQTVGPDALNLLTDLSRHLEEPTADSSALAVWCLCRGAAEHHKVAMAGDGADEVLAGYDTYRATLLAERYRRLPSVVRRQLIARIARALPASERKYGVRQRATRFTYGAELGPGRDHCAWRIIFTEELKRRLYGPSLRRRLGRFDALGRYAAHLDAVPPNRERLARLLNADTEFYLPNDMLVKVDRMSMAHGLEVRVPFLDSDLVRYCADLPADFKLRRGRIRKHLLREALRGSIPNEVLDAPKSGFNIPVDSWFRGPLRELLFDAIAPVRDDLGEILDLAALPAIVEEHQQRRADHGHTLFSVLMLGLWIDNARRSWRPDLRLAAPAVAAGTSGDPTAPS